MLVAAMHNSCLGGPYLAQTLVGMQTKGFEPGTFP